MFAVAVQSRLGCLAAEANASPLHHVLAHRFSSSNVSATEPAESRGAAIYGPQDSAIAISHWLDLGCCTCRINLTGCVHTADSSAKIVLRLTLQGIGATSLLSFPSKGCAPATKGIGLALAPHLAESPFVAQRAFGSAHRFGRTRCSPMPVSFRTSRVCWQRGSTIARQYRDGSSGTAKVFKQFWD